jgi:hypothetical protein
LPLDFGVGFNMTLIAHTTTKLKTLGVDCDLVGNEIQIKSDDGITRLRIDEGWDEAYKQYKQARSLVFDSADRTLTYNNSVEFVLVRLAPGAPLIDQYVLQDRAGNSVSLGTASMIFSLAFFDSQEYEAIFKARMERRLTGLGVRRFSYLMWSPTTATYTAKGRKTPPNLKSTGLITIKNCLFKVAVEDHDCLSVWAPKTKRLKTTYFDDGADDNSIPRSNYDENVVSYYKVATASPFPSQSFLAYYHVLEYHFLRVSEDLLHHRLTVLLNEPRFKTGRDNLDKVISIVRGQDARSDETEMLRNVLNRYIQETDLIEFIGRVEAKCEEKIYTKKRKVFGELIEISAREGHALANAANAIKHVRNAIVHSSDRYNRDECHIPLSDSENTIEEFIPLVRYIAEKVIFGTAV